MGSPSTKAKQKWNNEHYAPISIRVDKRLAAGFKSKCMENGLSVAGVLTEFMEEYCETKVRRHPMKQSSDNRGKRRREIERITAAVEDVLERETVYLNNIPENLQNSVRYETAEDCAGYLEAALEYLREAY